MRLKVDQALRLDARLTELEDAKTPAEKAEADSSAKQAIATANSLTPQTGHPVTAAQRDQLSPTGKSLHQEVSAWLGLYNGWIVEEGGTPILHLTGVIFTPPPPAPPPVKPPPKGGGKVAPPKKKTPKEEAISLQSSISAACEFSPPLTPGERKTINDAAAGKTELGPTQIAKLKARIKQPCPPTSKPTASETIRQKLGADRFELQRRGLATRIRLEPLAGRGHGMPLA